MEAPAAPDFFVSAPKSQKMKIVAIILFCISVAHAYTDKDKEIESFISMQQQIFEIAKRHHENPFLEGTSNLNHAVESELQ